MLVTSLENAINGELAIRRISPVNTGSARTRSHSSLSDVSVPDKTFIARSATVGKGGSFSKANNISGGLADCARLAARVPIYMTRKSDELAEKTAARFDQILLKID